MLMCAVAAFALLPGYALSADRKKFIQTLIHAARLRTQKLELYDPAYRQIAYPMGDVPEGRGVCTDVVIRAYRAAGVDLQVLVHQDMSKNFALYPKLWGMRGTDRNIDHRRVPNLQTFFRRQGAQLAIGKTPQAFKPGDLVTWMLPGNRPHIGIVSDRYAPDKKTPLILHNIGLGSVEDDILFEFTITGHYRYHP
jgi:uncharacterized protein YijF (DUF1287 family)